MQLIRRIVQFEVPLYFTVYIIYLLFGLWSLYAVRDRILSVKKFEFASGWSLLGGRPRDDTNDELENFTLFVRTWWLWYIVHAAVNSTVRVFWPQRQCSAHAIVCTVALFCTMRLAPVVVLLTLLMTYYIVARFCGGTAKRITWMLSIIWMFIINLIKNSDKWHNSLGYTEFFTLIITLSWSLLRCCSFSLSRTNHLAAGVRNLDEAYSVEHFIGYTLYFPSLVYGPFLSYHRYAVLFKSKPPTKDQLTTCFLTLCWELLRVGFWWICLQVSLHFLYVHYMARDVSAVAMVGPTFGQHAVGYFMGQFFFLYYVITYGLGIAFARFDGMHPPRRPRCIGRIHFYSDMWKYFDEGLYEFLFRHIYAELCSRRSSLIRKLFATGATFAFVFIWHGCYTYVLIWSVLNFGCLVAEKCLKTFVTSKLYTEWVTFYLGKGGAQRFRALLATQLFIPAAFSNVYFISGQEVGDYLMRGAYLSGIKNYIALTFCSYCFFQCSEVILKMRKSDF